MPIRSPKVAPIAASLALAAISTAQSIVVPNANATASTGSVLNNQVRETAMPRSYLQGIAAAELSGLPIGAVITGLSYRAGNTTSNATNAMFPATDATWANYDISIGPAAPLASWTGTVATNFSGIPTPVRGGPMVIEANSFVYNPAITTPTAQSWGTFYWDLQTPFTYVGGDLAIYFSHPGSNVTGSIWLDAVAATTANVKAQSATSYQATVMTTTATTFSVVRIHYGYGKGCPGTGGKIPNLVLTNDVKGGGSAAFAASNGLMGGVAAFVIGVTPLAIPLPNGCTLLNDALVTVPTTLSTYGRASITGTFPAGIAGTIVCQLVTLDAGAPMGFATSLGGKLTVSP